MNQVPLTERFRPFFNPNSIVIIGASRNEYTFNGIIIKNLLESQFKRQIILIHPLTDEIMGIPCLKSLEELEEKIQKKALLNNKSHMIERPDLAIIITPRDLSQTIMKLGEMGIQYIMIETDLKLKKNSNERIELLQKIKNLIDKYQLKIMGPSMIGIIDIQHNFTSSIIPVRSHIITSSKTAFQSPAQEGISFIAQSGGLSGACGWWLPSQGAPFSKIIHIGDSIGINESEIFEYLLLDPLTKVIILFLREITPSFVEVLQKYPKSKPVLYKYVGKDSPIESAFQSAGAMAVTNYIELFDFAKVLLWCPSPKTHSIGIVGPSAGAISLLLNEMRKSKIHLAKLNEDNKKMILDKIGGSTCELGNPVDYWPPAEFVGTTVCRIYHNASNALLQDMHVGGLFLALEFFTEIEFNFSIFEKIKEKYPDKPIICVLIQAEKEGADRILKIASQLHIPVFIDETERAVRSFECLLNYYQIGDN